MARGSCVGLGDNRPNCFNIAFLAILADKSGAGLGGEDERASLGSAIAKDDAFGD